ncbi:hypothetical protein FHS22_006031 [Planomonospora venezuelensis]|uniref:Uncharacterized protein n=1 Tax=Planomonospora venezuelensis TaxID=1999 RepID=A0A841DF75_PLAVE|nr:hypothetical protein [Planomonospora venezuelensis]
MHQLQRARRRGGGLAVLGAQQVRAGAISSR